MRRPLALGLVVATLAGCSGDDGAGEAAPPTTTAADAPSLYDIEVGDCLNGLDEDRDRDVEVVPCNRRHQAEVYGAYDLPGEGPDGVRYPGARVLGRRVATECATQFTTYTGTAPSIDTPVAFTEVVPSRASWRAGDRAAVCLAVGPDGRLTRGSIRQGSR